MRTRLIVIGMLNRPALVGVTLLGLAGCSGKPRPLDNLPPPRPPATEAAVPTLRVVDAALAGGAPALALQMSEDILARHPRDVGAMVRRGDALFELGRRDDAAASYTHALGLDRDNIPARIGLARTRLATDPAAAESILTEIVAREPHNAAAQNDLGIARDLQGRHLDAEAAYRAAISVTPENPAIQINYGLSLALAGKPAEALRILRPIAENPDATPRARQDLAVALTLSGDTAGAEKLLGKDLSADQVADAIAGYQALGTK